MSTSDTLQNWTGAAGSREYRKEANNLGRKTGNEGLQHYILSEYYNIQEELRTGIVTKRQRWMQIT